MNRRCLATLFFCSLIVSFATSTHFLVAEEPHLRLNSTGPTSLVTSLAFSAGGERLYAGSWDKLVHVWQSENGRFLPVAHDKLRQPIGPGLEGAVNAIAMDASGQYLAIAGRGTKAGLAGFRDAAFLVPSSGGLDDAMRLEEGTILLVDLKTRNHRRLQAHRGAVIALAFSDDNGPPVLVSAAHEWDVTQSKLVGKVRAWSLDKDQPFAEFPNPLPEPTTAPGLLIKRSQDRQQMRAYIAWNDGRLRSWDLKRQTATEVPDGRYNTALCSSKDTDDILSASLSSNNRWEVKIWSTQNLAPVVKRTIARPASAQSFELPRDMCLIDSNQDGKQDLIGIVGTVYKLKAGQWQATETELVCADLATTSISSRYRLWSSDGSSIKSTIAASGNSVAVCGAPTNQIIAYKASELRTKTATPQILSSDVTKISKAAFVKKEDRDGILLTVNDSTDQGQQELVLSLSESSLSKDRTGWLIPKRQAQPSPIQVQLNQVSIPRGNGTNVEISLKDRGTVTAHAAFKIDSVDLLALATSNLGIPTLAVFDLHNGNEIRNLVGHAQNVSSLDWSQDGRRLVSVGLDQTLCVWDLSEIGETLGKRGSLAGVAVEDSPQGIVVRNVESNRDAAKRWKIGDVLLGGEMGDQDVKWEAAANFYQFWWSTAPGTPAKLKSLRAGSVTEHMVTTDQGIDIKMPLLTFAALKSTQSSYDWVAWSPFGLFESSGERVESQLGWQFNGDTLDQPVSFAKLSEYRERFHQPGLLKELFERGKVVPPEAVTTRPTMSFLIDEQLVDASETASPSPSDVELTLPRNKLLLQLSVDSTFSSADIEKIDILLNEQPLSQLELDDRGYWATTVDTTDLTDGRHLITAVLATKRHSKVFREWLPFNVESPPPKIVLGDFSSVTSEETFELHADVHGQSEQVVELHRVEDDGSTTSIQQFEGQDTWTIATKVPLKLGRNDFRLIGGLLSAIHLPSRPTTTRACTIVREPPQSVAAPMLVVEKILSTSDGPVPTVNLTTVLSLSDEIRIVGSIRSPSQISKFSVKRGSTEKDVPLASGQTDEVYAFDIPMKLEAGEQSVEFKVQSKAGSVGYQSWVFTYQPSLPNIESPQALPDLIVEQLSPPSVDWVASFPKDQSDFSVEILRNGSPLPNSDVEIDRAHGQLTCHIPLMLGENSIRIQLKNRWGASKILEPMLIEYRPSPVVTKAELSYENRNEDPVLRLEGTAIADIDRILIAGREYPPKSFQQDRRGDRFSISVPVVLADDTLNSIPVDLTCAHTTVPTRVNVLVPESPKSIPLPEIAVFAPRTESVTSTASQRVSFSIRSATGLDTFELWNNGELIQERILNSDLKLVDSIPITLSQGINHLEIRVRATRGPTVVKSLTVGYIPPPVSVSVDYVLDDQDRKYELRRNYQGYSQIDEKVSGKRLRIFGHVDLPDQQSRSSTERIRLWVNGFQQPPEKLAKTEKAEQLSYVAEISLNKSGTNWIELDLPGIEKVDGSNVVLRIESDAALSKKRLHLLAIAIGSDELDADLLVNQAVSALAGTRNGGRTFTSSTFEAASIYGPLTGKSVSRERVAKHLFDIHEHIRQLNRVDPANDVVLIYYHGGEVVDAKNEFYLTTRQDDEMRVKEWTSSLSALETHCISSQLLGQFVDNTEGAHVMFLDVDRRFESTQQARKPERSVSARGALFRMALVVGGREGLAKSTLLDALVQTLPRGTELGSLGISLENLFIERSDSSRQLDNYVPERLLEIVLAMPRK